MMKELIEDYFENDKTMEFSDYVESFNTGNKIITEIDYEYTESATRFQLNDNRMSLYSAQKGKDPITGNLLIESLEVHHILPKSQGGQDNYENLILINENTHRLIHVVNSDMIEYYLKYRDYSKKVIDKINEYRMKVGNERIMSER